MTNHNITTNHSRKNNIPILTIIFYHSQIDFSLVYCLTIIYINYTPLMLHLRSRKMWWVNPGRHQPKNTSPALCFHHLLSQHFTTSFCPPCLLVAKVASTFDQCNWFILIYCMTSHSGIAWWIGSEIGTDRWWMFIIPFHGPNRQRSKGSRFEKMDKQRSASGSGFGRQRFHP